MANRQKRAQDRGKSFERWVAKQLGTTRVLQKGTKVPDVEYGKWKIDCKHRKNFVAFSGYHECKEKYGENTIVVMCKPQCSYKDSIVIMSWEDWKELAGEIHSL